MNLENMGRSLIQMSKDYEEKLHNDAKLKQLKRLSKLDVEDNNTFIKSFSKNEKNIFDTLISKANGIQYDYAVYIVLRSISLLRQKEEFYLHSATNIEENIIKYITHYLTFYKSLKQLAKRYKNIFKEDVVWVVFDSKKGTIRKRDKRLGWRRSKKEDVKEEAFSFKIRYDENCTTVVIKRWSYLVDNEGIPVYLSLTSMEEIFPMEFSLI